MAAIAKIVTFHVRFRNELSSAASATVVHKVKVSSGDPVNHQILGYYGHPKNSANILIDFECAHPSSGPAKYQNGGGPPERRWKGELEVDAVVRRPSAVRRLRELVVTAPPAPVGAVIECSFEVKKRWSREWLAWMPVDPGLVDTCALTYRVEP